ncbi:hypothetical protein ACR777_15130 [Sphingobacterium spiritivorum]|uniref:hypothetical protein n=1 Tax=Sphingobacterium spiritivorum TaxID=258 RepID=UPI003DA24E59
MISIVNFLVIDSIIGDTDVAQTWIQLVGLMITFVSFIAVIITINLQLLALNEQNKINAKTMDLINLQIKQTAKDIFPEIKVDFIKDDNQIEVIRGYLNITVQRNNMIIESIKLNQEGETLLHVWEVNDNYIEKILQIGNYDVVKIEEDKYYLAKKTEFEKTGSFIPMIEIIYSDEDSSIRRKTVIEYLYTGKLNINESVII